MFRWLVNVVLLAFPIITTIAILIGLQSASDEPILPDNGIVGGGGGGVRKGDNTLKKYVECNKTIGIHPPTAGQGYTLNPNPWGWDEGSPGSICVDVLGFNNGTYASKKTAPEFWITWQYPQDNPSLPVHAFANIMIEDKDVLPVALSDISKLSLDLEWTYTVGNSSWNATDATDETELTDNDTNTNVAIDMFLHSDKTKAVTPSTAAYEVMVWFATFGPATQPLGYETIIATQTVEGITFNLHSAKNENDQSVLTWVAANTTEKFHGDLFPLVEYVLTTDGENFPNTSDYLGYVGLGTEALHATKEVTFHVPQLSIDIESKKT